MPNVIEHDQFQIVSELLKRQDSALDELESLNLRVESAIKEITAQREKELAELAAESGDFDGIAGEIQSEESSADAKVVQKNAA